MANTKQHKGIFEKVWNKIKTNEIVFMAPALCGKKFYLVCRLMVLILRNILKGGAVRYCRATIDRIASEFLGCHPQSKTLVEKNYMSPVRALKPRKA